MDCVHMIYINGRICGSRYAFSKNAPNISFIRLEKKNHCMMIILKYIIYLFAGNVNCESFNSAKLMNFCNFSSPKNLRMLWRKWQWKHFFRWQEIPFSQWCITIRSGDSVRATIRTKYILRDATHWSSKSKTLHLPPSLSTFHILLLCWFPGNLYWAKGKQAQNQQKRKRLESFWLAKNITIFASSWEDNFLLRVGNWLEISNPK